MVNKYFNNFIETFALENLTEITEKQLLNLMVVLWSYNSKWILVDKDNVRQIYDRILDGLVWSYKNEELLRWKGEDRRNKFKEEVAKALKGGN